MSAGHEAEEGADLRRRDATRRWCRKWYAFSPPLLSSFACISISPSSPLFRDVVGRAKLYFLVFADAEVKTRTPRASDATPRVSTRR